MFLFDTPTLLAYVAAAVALVVIPGPGTAWIVAQTAAGGTARGLRAGLGLETATLLHAVAAGLGLSAVLATSALAFDLLKYAGAAYLVWLGIKAWRGEAKPPIHSDASIDTSAPVDVRGVYLRSVLTGVLNPKVAVFFLAFLPQFVRPERGHVWMQFLMLGVILSIIGMTHSTMLSIVTGRLRRHVVRPPRWLGRVTGTVFIGLGLRLALQQRG